MELKRITMLATGLVMLAVPFFSTPAAAKVNLAEMTAKTAEQQIRHLLEPLLDQYCHDDCRLMQVNVQVDIAKQDEVAPGFDDLDSQKTNELAPSGGRVKLLLADKLGPVSREKLLRLIQQFLDTLDFPIKVETQVAHFPQPQGSEGKVAELREKVAKQFRHTIEDLLNQFCPMQCLLADFNLTTEAVNGEEAQYGAPGEFVQDGDTAVKIKEIGGTLLVDDLLSPEERNNILEMAKLKTNYLKNVSLSARSMKFPRPSALDSDGTVAGSVGGKGKRGLASEKNTSDSKSNSTSTLSTEQKSTTQATNQNTNTNSENNTKQERFERFEKIERVESGDAVQAELQKFKVFGLIFACSIISLLIFIAMAGMRTKSSGGGTIQRVIQSIASDPTSMTAPQSAAAAAVSKSSTEDKAGPLSKRYEIERILDELTTVFATQPRVAKQVFTRVLTEEGVETTAQYIHLFGESVVVDMLRDPSLQTDLNELMEFYAKNPIELTDDEKLELLRALHARTVAGKLVVLGSRSSTLFDFLAEMDGMQILELIRTESLTVKSIILTQCDPQKRAQIYAQLDQETRMALLTELSRIDYLPKDYIFNVANALKRKRRENPKLNTEALPGSEVLVSLLERTGQNLQRTVVKNLEMTNPDSARTVKSKLVSIDTLKFLRDGQLLEVVLSLKHEELLQFLKGAADDTRRVIFSKSPKELVLELEEELGQMGTLSRETYSSVERKVLNRMKLMAQEGLLNLIETNERMFAENTPDMISSEAIGQNDKTQSMANIKKVAGW